MSITVLGLDQSLAHTGWSIFCLDKIACSEESLNLIKVGTINTDPQDELIKRLADIEFNVDSLIKNYKPDYVFLEVVFINKRGAGDFLNLIKVETTLLNYLYRTGISHDSIDSLRNRKHSWRKLFELESHKSESKNLLLKTNLNPPRLNNHNADACLIALAGLVKYSFLNKEELFTLLGLDQAILNKDEPNLIKIA